MVASNGYIKVHRKLRNWALYGDISCVRIFLHFMLLAQYKPTKSLARGRIIELQPGQCWFTVRQLAAELGITKKQCDRALSLMKKDGTLQVTRVGHSCSVATLCNWDTYNGSEVPSGDTVGDTVGVTSETLGGNIGDTEQERKKERKEEGKKKEGRTVRRFTPPTEQEVADYCKEKGYDIDPVKFWNFYDSKNWMIGGNKMSKWKSAVVTWSRNEKSFHPKPAKPKDVPL